MAQKASWTVDVEYDWGGRTHGTAGIEQGLPLILEEFDKRNIKGIFFISTELLRDFRKSVREIKERGHTIGSHGHFHVVWKDKQRAEEDRLISNTLLLPYITDHIPYRAPKFSYRTDDRFSNPEGHMGLLKYVWFRGRIPDRPIFYLHPFDIVSGERAPNLFCKLWYSKPDAAMRLFKRLCLQYSL